MNGERLLNAGIVIMAALVITLAGLRVHQWWAASSEYRPQRIEDWQQYSVGGSVLGAPDPAVTIVEWGDYQCPFCRTAESELRRVLETYPDAVRLVYRHYPLQIHSAAMPAAHAALCADRAGRFGAYHKLLFDASSLDSLSWSALAATAGVQDLEAFDTCVNDSSVTDQVHVDTLLASQLGIQGTPLFLVNDWLLPGYPRPGRIEEHVERILRRNGIDAR